MSRHRSKHKHQRPMTNDGQMAKMLLPPMPRNAPPYTRIYYESYRRQLFQACSNGRHRHCPKTTESRTEHLYCECPCHRKDLSKYQRRKIFLKLKADMEKALRKPRAARGPRIASAATVGARGQQKRFRFLRPMTDVPKGIMASVYGSIVLLKEGSVTEVAAGAEDAIKKVSKQDPVNQTSIMLHRLLKLDVVEVVI